MHFKVQFLRCHTHPLTWFLASTQIHGVGENIGDSPETSSNLRLVYMEIVKIPLLIILCLSPSVLENKILKCLKLAGIFSKMRTSEVENRKRSNCLCHMLVHQSVTWCTLDDPISKALTPQLAHANN
jgi:hypothetical protein